MTLENVLSSNYATEAESYVTDHFPFRDQWLWIKSVSEQARLQQENNGIYKGKDEYLFEKFLQPDYHKLQRYIEGVNTFGDNHTDVDITFMLAPTSVGLYPERLPWLAPSYSQEDVSEFVSNYLDNDITYMDGFDFLSPHASESIYYRTDHHWSTYGAYLAYVAYIEKKGWQPLSQDDFIIKEVSNSFLGSYHTRSQFHGLSPDMIEAYLPIEQVATEIFIADTNETLSSMYDESFLGKKDQYAYFLGGVHALMTIKSDLDKLDIKQDKLLIIKDSYAHNVIPFLTNHIPEIHVIDIRYYNGSIGEYMSDNGLKDVLYIFNISTFVEDASLLKLNN
ncbi:DHHW family protein [Ureibacillus manganicus]|nr:DHHW family protein [Ureibacillus manganicus]